MKGKHMAYVVISRYHSGIVKRRERPSFDGADRLAAWEVDVEGAYRATVETDGRPVIEYVWRGGLCCTETAA